MQQPLTQVPTIYVWSLVQSETLPSKLFENRPPDSPMLFSQIAMRLVAVVAVVAVALRLPYKYLRQCKVGRIRYQVRYARHRPVAASRSRSMGTLSGSSLRVGVCDSERFGRR